MKLLKSALTTSVRFSISAIFLTAIISCGKGSSKFVPSDVLTQTEEAVRKHFIFSGGSTDETLSGAYGAALKEISPGGDTGYEHSRDGLTRLINAAEDSKREELLFASLRAFLGALPEGGNGFISPEALRWSRDPERTAGVGLVIHEEAKRGKFLVIDTLDGSASNRERMEVGGYITAVDGVDVANMDLTELVGRIKGPSGTKVRIQYNDKEFTLVRGEIVFQNLLHAQWGAGDNRILYITLRSTLPGTADQLSALISSQDRLRGVVIDLRRLQQGSLEESFRIADLFLGKGGMGTLVKNGGKQTPFLSDPDTIFTGPVVLIGNHYTSLYGQILLMAMHGSKRVRTISSPFTPSTYISEIIPIPAGIELYITSGYLLDPAGKPFHATRFAPDREITDLLYASPPLTEPDKNDPAQLIADELLRSMGR
jgi:carboxyl-terminal processing protease